MYYGFQYADGRHTTTGDYEMGTLHIAGLLFAFADEGTRDDWVAESHKRDAVAADSLPSGWCSSEAICEHGDEPGCCELAECWAQPEANQELIDADAVPRIYYDIDLEMVGDGDQADLDYLVEAVAAALERRWPDADIDVRAVGNGGRIDVEPASLHNEARDIIDAAWEDENSWLDKGFEVVDRSVQLVTTTVPEGGKTLGVIRHPADDMVGALVRLPSDQLVHVAAGVVRSLPQLEAEATVRRLES
jgi:hypothetical protein